MIDDTTDRAAHANVLDVLYFHLSIELTDDWVPLLRFSISRAWDGSMPLSNHEISELGITVKIEPEYEYFKQLHSIPDEVLALSKHYNISDPQTYMLRRLEKEFGPIYFFSEPDLPPHWERQISGEGISYFYNKKTSARVWSPAEAFTCLYLSSSLFREID
jgi:hypothetical protein